MYFVFFSTLCFSNVSFVRSADGLASLQCFFKNVFTSRDYLEPVRDIEEMKLNASACGWDVKKKKQPLLRWMRLRFGLVTNASTFRGRRVKLERAAAARRMVRTGRDRSPFDRRLDEIEMSAGIVGERNSLRTQHGAPRSEFVISPPPRMGFNVLHSLLWDTLTHRGTRTLNEPVIQREAKPRCGASETELLIG